MSCHRDMPHSRKLKAATAPSAGKTFRIPFDIDFADAIWCAEDNAFVRAICKKTGQTGISSERNRPEA